MHTHDPSRVYTEKPQLQALKSSVDGGKARKRACCLEENNPSEESNALTSTAHWNQGKSLIHNCASEEREHKEEGHNISYESTQIKKVSKSACWRRRQQIRKAERKALTSTAHWKKKQGETDGNRPLDKGRELA
ncbi:hypothetical protein GOP47_0002262 [Adiantum capillus-veneris]|uniref:Uncharacterized protein n=1 Tax=Adiantum capillus-veneris TaxID=13818 RepID=A0A9D4VAK8_ADICA|nr:hypothetical protein GOP47_0002262 [Adiantum capillus-veneris]